MSRVRNTRNFIVGNLVIASALLLLGGETCLAQRQASGPLPDNIPRNSYLLPVFSKKLPKGRNVLNLKNPSHFNAAVQVRCGNSAAQFVLAGKAQTTLYLPDGEYSIFFRFLSDVRIREGRSFIASGGEFTFDDGKPMGSTRVLGDNRRR